MPQLDIASSFDDVMDIREVYDNQINVAYLENVVNHYFYHHKLPKTFLLTNSL